MVGLLMTESGGGYFLSAGNLGMLLPYALLCFGRFGINHISRCQSVYNVATECPFQLQD